MDTSGTIVTFEAVLEKFDPQSGWHYIPVSSETAAIFRFESNSRRVLCTLEDTEPFQCALMPHNGAYFVLVNKRMRGVLGVEAGDRLLVRLQKDESKYGLPMPEEFREVLNQDAEGDKLFHSLTPGKQRSLLYYVGKVKDIDRRIRVALVIVNHLRENGKVIDKMLYEELKRPEP
jgi:Domain of unknown function (DUF1905)/Bacteriocin-protection, YdeI or OmpD-Associated